MEKLFSDSETFMKDRPKKITSDQLDEFCLRLAKEIIKEQWSSDDEYTIQSDLKKLNEHDNRFEMAKDLESHGDASYNFEHYFLEFLESFYYEKSKIRDQNVRDWVRANNIKPKLSVGKKLMVITSGLFRPFLKDEIIYINGIYEDTAIYVVDKNKDKKGGTLIDYEKIEQNCLEIK